jgi:glutamate dehydrogenase (NADP+)
MSDSAGYIYDAEGIDAEKLAFVMELKNELREELASMLRNIQTLNISLESMGSKCDIALPCATQNELNERKLKL